MEKLDPNPLHIVLAFQNFLSQTRFCHHHFRGKSASLNYFVGSRPPLKVVFCALIRLSNRANVQRVRTGQLECQCATFIKPLIDVGCLQLVSIKSEGITANYHMLSLASASASPKQLHQGIMCGPINWRVASLKDPSRHEVVCDHINQWCLDLRCTALRHLGAIPDWSSPRP